jgi:hypothetical protein
VAFVALRITSVETPRRQSNTAAEPSEAPQPATVANVSKNAWPSSTGPVGTGEPDCMNAPRKRPSALPPFVSICSATEIAPADSPQLYARVNGVGGLALGIRNAHRDLRRVATECRDILLDPLQAKALYTV